MSSIALSSGDPLSLATTQLEALPSFVFASTANAPLRQRPASTVTFGHHLLLTDAPMDDYIVPNGPHAFDSGILLVLSPSPSSSPSSASNGKSGNSGDTASADQDIGTLHRAAQYVDLIESLIANVNATASSEPSSFSSSSSSSADGLVGVSEDEAAAAPAPRSSMMETTSEDNNNATDAAVLAAAAEALLLNDVDTSNDAVLAAIASASQHCTRVTFVYVDDDDNATKTSNKNNTATSTSSNNNSTDHNNTSTVAGQRRVIAGDGDTFAAAAPAPTVVISSHTTTNLPSSISWPRTAFALLMSPTNTGGSNSSSNNSNNHNYFSSSAASPSASGVSVVAPPASRYAIDGLADRQLHSILPHHIGEHLDADWKATSWRTAARRIDRGSIVSSAGSYVSTSLLAPVVTLVSNGTINPVGLRIPLVFASAHSPLQQRQSTTTAPPKVTEGEKQWLPFGLYPPAAAVPHLDTASATMTPISATTTTASATTSVTTSINTPGRLRRHFQSPTARLPPTAVVKRLIPIPASYRIAGYPAEDAQCLTFLAPPPTQPPSTNTTHNNASTNNNTSSSSAPPPPAPGSAVPLAPSALVTSIPIGFHEGCFLTVERFPLTATVPEEWLPPTADVTAARAYLRTLLTDLPRLFEEHAQALRSLNNDTGRGGNSSNSTRLGGDADNNNTSNATGTTPTTTPTPSTTNNAGGNSSSSASLPPQQHRRGPYTTAGYISWIGGSSSPAADGAAPVFASVDEYMVPDGNFLRYVYKRQ